MNLIIILSTFRYLKYGFAGLTLFLLVTGLVAALATTRDKDPGPSEYASKAILELLGRIPYSPLSMETRSYSSLESKETFTPGRHHSGSSLDPLETHVIPVNTGNARVAKRSAQMDEDVLPVMTDPFGFGKLTVKVRMMCFNSFRLYNSATPPDHLFGSMIISSSTSTFHILSFSKFTFFIQVLLSLLLLQSTFIPFVSSNYLVSLTRDH